MLNIPKFPINTYFWSDLHLGHNREFILNPRKFCDVQQAIDITFKRQQESIKNDDFLFLLGDTVVGAGDTAEQLWDRLLFEFQYQKLFIMPGNHYAYLKELLIKYGYLNSSEYDYAQKLNFPRDIYFIPNYYEVKIGKQYLVLSHYPILSFNHCSKSAIHIFGHCHNSLSKNKIGQQWISDMKVIDVGLENCSSPISFNELSKLFVNKTNQPYDHH